MSCFFPAAIHVYSLATTWSSGLAKKLTLVYCTVLPCGPSQPESRGLKYVCAWGVRTSKCCYNCCITLLTTTREQGWHSGDNSRLPPTLPEFDSGLVSCMGRVCYCQSHLAPRVFFFSRDLWFSSLHENKLCQISIRSGQRTRMKASYGWCGFVSKYYKILYFILSIYQNQSAWMQFLACHSPCIQMTPFGEKQNFQYWRV